VSVELEPAAETIPADAALLRVALHALADEMRSRSGANTAPLSIRAFAGSDGVRVAIGSTREDGGWGSPGRHRGLGLGLARRIAELHGGGLAEDAATGEVVLTLPVA